MRLVHLYVHGRGRGHGSRSRAVTDHLRAHGWQVRVFAGPDGLNAFEAGDATEVTSLMPGDGLSSARIVRERMGEALTALRGDQAQAIISDGDLPGVLAARVGRVPSVALGHGLVFSHTRRPRSLPAGPWLREGMKARIASVGTQRQIAVNFVPLEPNSPTTTVAQPILRPELANATGNNRERSDELLCYFRDDNGGAVLEALSEQGTPVRLFAKNNPELAGIQWEKPDAARFTEALLSTRGVISSAGSQLISECVALGVPQLALYDARDDEQRLNVGMLKAARLGDGMPFEEATSDQVHGFLGRLEDEASPRGLAPWGPDAAEATETALRTLLD